MKAQVFLEWMETTGIRKAVEIVDQLGVGRNQAQQMVADARAGNDLDVKKAVALAMRAIADDRPPWGEERTDDD